MKIQDVLKRMYSQGNKEIFIKKLGDHNIYMNKYCIIDLDQDVECENTQIITDGMYKVIDTQMNMDFNKEIQVDYNSIKDGIKTLCGRKRDLVIYHIPNTDILVNARFLLNMMDGVKGDVIRYVDNKHLLKIDGDQGNAYVCPIYRGENIPTWTLLNDITNQAI